MSLGYVSQHVKNAICELIGEESPENRARLEKAAMRAQMGLQPISRPFLSSQTSGHLAQIESDNLSFEDLKEHLAEFIMGSQVDVGSLKEREKNT